jgi:hypothetical protein
MTRATLAAIAGIALAGCSGSSAPQSVATPSGTFVVPGQAQVRGGPDLIVLVTTEEGCEMHGGLTLDLDRSRTREGRVTFHFHGASSCGGSGWISAEHLTPIPAAAPR